ncbi:MAG: translation initiation factor IF-2 [bacterium]
MTPQTSKNLITKPPVVTIMGHVDHGKTTLLDYIRKTKVAEKEEGGITQQIGAYQVEFKNRKITFVDTPGHAAFAKMRAMGEKVADIVIIIVAANDGVKPQTLEAIDLAKSSGTPFVIAFNKIDLPDVDINRVKKQLADNDILVEGWGGNIVCVEISAKSGNGVDTLLEVIMLMADMLELTASVTEPFSGIIIESKKDPKKGAVCSIVAKNGKLSVGNTIYSQDGQKIKIRALVDFKGSKIKTVFPGDPVEVLGFTKPPKIGMVVSSSPELFKLEKVSSKTGKVRGEESPKGKTLNLIIKADTRGSADAIETTLREIKKEDFFINILYLSVGSISESDILLANSSKAIILAFNVNVPKNVTAMAESYKVIIRTYKIIYKLFEEVEGALEGIFELAEEKIKGRAEVIAKFKLPKSGDIVSGCRVLAGRLKVKDKINMWLSMEEFKKSKDDLEMKPLYVGVIKSLRIGKNEVNVAGKDNEAGVFLNPPFPEVKVGYVVEVL